MSTLPGVPSGVTIDNTLGAVLVGFAFACCIYGILFSQVFSYFSNYPSDRLVYKFLVVLILCMETTDQALIGHILYFYGISNYAKIVVLLKAETTWSLILQQTIGAMVGAIVKLNFALRVWRFSERNWYITFFVMFLVFGQLGTSFAFTVEAFKLPNIFAVVHLRTLGTAALAIGVFTDAVIAISLCYYLNRLRTGYQQSDTLVNSLVRYAINTGAVTRYVTHLRGELVNNPGECSAVSLTTLILYNLMPTNLIFVGTFFILSKLYAISFMATLNTRRVVRGKGTDRQGTSNHTNIFHLGTRVPTMGPNDNDLEGWESAYTLTNSQTQLSSGKVKSPTTPYSQYSQSPYSQHPQQHPYLYPQQDPFPSNSSQDAHSNQKMVYGEAI
ncbi:hypothetical protein L218DRAFT_1080363 [Marasmius fiardii PR-910]|nr:hypothetical protein L218DRAFT_1080363 [Marasmius fiardii PR-910]